MSTDVAELGLKLQVGLESVYATAVAATKIMKSFRLDFDPQLETDQFFPAGNIFPSSSTVNMEWVEGAIDGVLTYGEVLYPLHMMFGVPDVAGVDAEEGADTSLLAKDWEWTINANDLLVPKSGTLERGSSVYGTRAAGVVVNQLQIESSRRERIALTGSILAGRLDKPHTPTALSGPGSTVEQVRVLPSQVDLFVDDTYAAMTGASPTKLLRSFRYGFSLDGLYSAVWAQNSALASYDGIVPIEPTSEATALLMADANGLAFLDTARAGQTKYVMWRATGPVIDTVGATTFRYMFEVQHPVQIKDVAAFENAEGVYAIPWTFQPIDDAVNPPLKIRIRNKIAAV
jgi:hypothetical protein